MVDKPEANKNAQSGTSDINKITKLHSPAENPKSANKSNKASRYAHATKEKIKRAFNRIPHSAAFWTAWATVLMAVTTGIYTHYARRQWQEMHSTGEQTDKIITAAQGIETHAKQMVADNKQVLTDNKVALAETLGENRQELSKLLDQNRKTLNASINQSKLSLDAAIDNFRLDQRAWVGIQNIQIDRELNKPIVIRIDVANRGKTPALEYRGQIYYEPVPQGHKLVPYYPPNETPNLFKVVLLPGTPSGIILGGKQAPLDQKTIDLLDRGIVVMHVYGRLCYQDVFNRHHWTRFCLQYDPIANGFEGCDTYNETDNGKNSSQEQCATSN